VCREVVEYLIQVFFNYIWDQWAVPGEDMSQQATSVQHTIATLALVLSAMVVALSTCDLGFVLYCIF
jgi:hypothetical protein